MSKQENLKNNKNLPQRVMLSDVNSINGLRSWIAKALKDHYKGQEVSDSDLQILFPKIKELVYQELREEDDQKLSDRWILEMSRLENKLKKMNKK